MTVLQNWGKKDISPFGCESIENQTGKYDKTQHRCGGSQSCRFNVDIPEDGIQGGRYMAICKRKADGTIQNCPGEDHYPWLVDHCGGNSPCKDCGA